MSNDFFYRYEDVAYAAPLDEFDMPIGEGQVRVILRRFRVDRRTPKGAWIRPDYGTFQGSDRKFVLLDARKRYACPTIDEARKSFVARKRKQLKIYRARIRQAERALSIIDSGTTTVPDFFEVVDQMEEMKGGAS